MEPAAKPRMRRRLRFTCACCKRRRGFTRLSGRWSKREPLCEDCAMRLEREQWNESTIEEPKE
jgi:hypothetical protein